MKFGVFSVVDHYPKELSRTSGDFYGELLEQVEAADDLGFDSFWIAIPNFGGLPHKQVMRSMELMARHVLSRF
jgi:alkanesulfonate monooxygenase SsuD/methylene tetrahydromethanopterin reductase-like flavin-dependent oxidoreductase (luciferase family)